MLTSIPRFYLAAQPDGMPDFFTREPAMHGIVDRCIKNLHSMHETISSAVGDKEQFLRAYFHVGPDPVRHT